MTTWLKNHPCENFEVLKGYANSPPISFSYSIYQPNVHLITRHAFPLGYAGSIFKPVDFWTWIAFLVTIIVSLILLLILHQLFKYAKPSMLNQSIDIGQLAIRIVAGFTEPDYVMPFNGILSGMVYHNLKIISSKNLLVTFHNIWYVSLLAKEM